MPEQGPFTKRSGDRCVALSISSLFRRRLASGHRQRYLVEGSRGVFLSEPRRNEIELLVAEAVDISSCLQGDALVYLRDHLPFCEDVLDVPFHLGGIGRKENMEGRYRENKLRMLIC